MLWQRKTKLELKLEVYWKWSQWETDGILYAELDNYNLKVSNAFTPLLDNPFVSKSLPIATLSPPRSSIPAVTTTSETPPKPNSDQLANSFQKFLQVFKDENNQLKYRKKVETMKKIRISCLAIDIQDIQKQNHFLADIIRDNYWNLLPTLKKEARTFVTEFLGFTLGPTFLFSITRNKWI